MRIYPNKGDLSQQIVQDLEDRAGIAKSASTNTPIYAPISPAQLAVDIHDNRIAASMSRSGFSTSSPAGSENLFEKLAENRASELATKLLISKFKEIGITPSINSVISVDNMIFKQAGLTGRKKTPTVSYADICVELTHSALGNKTAATTVSIREGNPAAPYAFSYNDNEYEFSKEGWQKLVADSREINKKANTTTKKFVVRHFTKIASDGTVKNVPNGYYEVLGETDNYVKVSHALKNAGILIANRPADARMENCIEPLCVNAGDYEKVAAIIGKYCASVTDVAIGDAPPSDAVTPDESGDSKATAVIPKANVKGFVDKLKTKGKSAVVEPIQGSGDVSITTDTPKTAATRNELEQMLDLSEDIYQRIQADVTNYRGRELTDKEREGIKKNLIDFISNSDIESLKSLAEADVNELTTFTTLASLTADYTFPDAEKQAPQTESIPAVEPPIERTTDNTEPEQEVTPQEGASTLPFQMADSADAGQEANLAFSAERKEGTPWSEGSNDAPTKNQGPASGGRLEVKGPGGTQKMTNNDGSKRAPAEKEREQSIAWSNGSGSEGVDLMRDGSNKPPTHGQGPDGKAVEMNGPGGHQKNWQQEPKPGSTTKPSDNGTVDEFMSRENDAGKEGNVDEFFEREGGQSSKAAPGPTGSAKSDAGSFMSREAPSGPGSVNHFFPGGKKGGGSKSSGGGMSMLMKGSSTVGPKQAAFRENLMRKMGYTDEQIAKRCEALEKTAGPIGAGLGSAAGAALGNLVLPGVGGLAGRAIGGWLGNKVESNLTGGGNTAGNPLANMGGAAGMSPLMNIIKQLSGPQLQSLLATLQQLVGQSGAGAAPIMSAAG